MKIFFFFHRLWKVIDHEKWDAFANRNSLHPQNRNRNRNRKNNNNTRRRRVSFYTTKETNPKSEKGEPFSCPFRILIRRFVVLVFGVCVYAFMYTLTVLTVSVMKK